MLCSDTPLMPTAAGTGPDALFSKFIDVVAHRDSVGGGAEVDGEKVPSGW